MKSKRKKFWSGDNRFRLMLTLELAVMLPAAALIYFNFHYIDSIKRNGKVETLIHSEFQYVLAVSEKKINQKIYSMTEEVRDLFPSPESEADSEKEGKLDLILAKNPWLAHVFLFDAEKGLLFRSQPQQMGDKDFREEHESLIVMFRGWFSLKSNMLEEELRKNNRLIYCSGGQAKRAGGYAYLTTAFFLFPQFSKDRLVLGGASIDPNFLKQTFFPEMLDELITQKLSEDKGDRLAMMVYPVDSEGWTENKALSVLLVAGLALAYRSVRREVELARLKSDFVSNVSHELRTPLSLIWLYAETLELGRINTREKKEEYYRIIRKESERLTALINNILDFSRIEAGRKEYDFRETDIAELVRNTLDAYRYQIEQQGFAFEQHIESSIPAVRVDREAIARAHVNLINNALKYSAHEKFLGVKLYRANDLLKLEVIDRGIGITRREQSKIFEKFYRTGDPLVHNTKGSGLGLSLVRHITQAHGGEIVVESTPGKGSKFTLSLPLAAATRRSAH